MAKKYNTGSKERAIRMMAMCAIRDQEALIDALTPPMHLMKRPDDETQKSIDECKLWIEDFKRIARSVTANAVAHGPADGPAG